MDLTLYFTFVLISIGLIIIPGPNVLVIVSTSISHGKSRGLQSVLGTSSAMVIQLVVAAVATALFVTQVTNGLTILKWLGVAYLIYLGLLNLYRGMSKNLRSEQLSATGSFVRGFIVSLTNPKTLLFFGAFLPQFISGENPYWSQIAILSILFLVLATVLDSCYALGAAYGRNYFVFGRMQKIHARISGILYLAAGLWLGSTNKI